LSAISDIHLPSFVTYFTPYIHTFASFLRQCASITHPRIFLIHTSPHETHGITRADDPLDITRPARVMSDDPTHRRRSASIVHAAGGKHMASSKSKSKHAYRQSSISLGTNGTTDPKTGVIHEDSDPGPSSSDLEMNDMRSDDDDMTDDEETGLTQAERRKRRRRKRRSTMLDERVAGSNGGNMGDLKRTEEELAKANLVRMYGVNAILIALWYTFSISISVYNKWMFSKENLDFHFPLFTTSLHMVVQFTCASAVLFLFPQLRPGAGSADTHAQGYSAVDGDEDGHERRSSPPPENKGPLMTRWFYFTRIGPCGTATALDIGLGNFSLRFISLTFFTMCKSSVLAFVLLFAFIFRLEKPSWRLGGIITLMSVGVIMMVAGETAFNALGFILVMTASFCSGFRWSLTQILLLRNPATSNPFSSIFFLTPVMFLSLFLLALPIEGPSNLMTGLHTLAETKGVLLGTLIMLFPGALAFLMVAAEFALLKRTSVVTLSVCGIFKEVLTISAAGAVFGDELSPINVSGLVVTIASIAAYNYLKYLKMRSDAQKQAHEFLEDEGAVEEGDLSDGPKNVSDGLSYDGTQSNEPKRHKQTSALMRHSLSLAIGDNGFSSQHGAVQGGSSQSPVKRPENLK
jgi:solute carrier family 35 protein C2